MADTDYEDLLEDEPDFDEDDQGSWDIEGSKDNFYERRLRWIDDAVKRIKEKSRN